MVRTFLHQTFHVYHVCFNLILEYVCRIAGNFDTLKDESLLIHMFASNYCFSGRNIFQNGVVDALSKIDDAYFTKRWRFHIVRIFWLCWNCDSLRHQHLLWYYKWNFGLLMSAFATAIRNTLLETSTFNTNFCVQALPCFHCFCNR